MLKVLDDARHCADCEVARYSTTDLEKTDRCARTRTVLTLIPLHQRLELLCPSFDREMIGKVAHHHIGSEHIAYCGVFPSGHVDRNSCFLRR